MIALATPHPLISLLCRSVATTYRDRYLATTKGSGTQTVKGDLDVLRAAVRYLQDLGMTLRRPARIPLRVRRSYSHHTPASAEVAAVLEEMISPWHRAALCLLWGTGARIGDLALLTWGDIEQHTLTIPEGSKTGRRTIPLTARAIEGLQILRTHHDGEPDASIWPPQRSLRQAVNGAIARAAVRAEVQRFTCHALRRLAINELRQAGVELEVVAAITGHSAKTLLRHYRQVNPLEVVAALESAPLGEVPAGTVLTGNPYWKQTDAG